MEYIYVIYICNFSKLQENKSPGTLQLMKSYTYIVCKELYEKIQYNISGSHICAYDSYNSSEHRISYKK